MKRIYYPDHDQRYAHIHPDDRWKYPDEIRFGFLHVYKRTKPAREITAEDTQGGAVKLDPVLLASDIPFTECLVR